MALSKMQKFHIDAYYELSKHHDYDEIFENISSKKFSRKDVNITPRELNHWASKKLLYEDYDNSKWKKFNILDILWIQFLVELRKYELPLSIISLIKEGLNSKLDLSVIFNENPEDVLKSTKAALSEENRDKFTDEDLLQVIKELNLKNISKDYFELIVMESYFLKHNSSLLINFEGRCLFYTELYYDELRASDEYKLHFESSHISVSVNVLIAKVFTEYNAKELAMDWKLISTQEQNILEVIQSQKNIKSLKIRFNEDSEIDLLEIVDEIKMKPQDYLKKIILEGSYLDIKILTQNGQIVLCERTTKTKI